MGVHDIMVLGGMLRDTGKWSEFKGRFVRVVEVCKL